MKALVVDDNPDMRLLVSLWLKKAGFKTITADDGSSGIEIALSQRPELVLIDRSMPVMDGLTASAAIRERLDPAPVIVMMSSEGEEEDVQAGLAAGVDAYMIKPFSTQELLACVNSAMAKAGHGIETDRSD